MLVVILLFACYFTGLENRAFGFTMLLFLAIIILKAFWDEKKFIKKHSEDNLENTELYKTIVNELKQSGLEKKVNIKTLHKLVYKQLKEEQPYFTSLIYPFVHMSKTPVLCNILNSISKNGYFFIEGNKKNLVFYRTPAGKTPSLIRQIPSIIDHDVNLVITSLKPQNYFHKVVMQEYRDI